MKKTATILTAMAISLGMSASLRGQTPESSPTAPATLTTPTGLATHPFWKSDIMARESVLFVVKEGQTEATANLLFAPDDIISVQSASGERVFRPNVDFTWKPGSRELTLTANSPIPSRTLAQMFPKDAPNNTPMLAKTPPKGLGPYLMWAEGHVFHDLQVEVTYRHKEKWTGSVPHSATAQLPRTMALLKARKPVKLVVLGDSISAGYNASGMALINVKPNTPPYPQLVAAGLEGTFGSKVTLTNLAVGGTGVAWGITRAPAVAQENPDLVILAFGLNDTGIPRTDWANQMKQLVAAIRNGAKDTEFILVSPMCGNPQWEKMPDGAVEGFRETLRQQAGPGIAAADVTSLWLDLAKRKPYWEYTGNGLNHPNDFGHRLYAQVILALFQ